MSSLNRTLAGANLQFDLEREIESVRGAQPESASGRTARTLVKDGPLRVTLTVMRAGSEIAEHAAEGPITIHVLRGSILIVLGGAEVEIRSGELVAAPARERHAVRATEEAAFLLTVVMPGG